MIKLPIGSDFRTLGTVWGRFRRADLAGGNMPLTGGTLRAKSLVSLSVCSLSFPEEANPQIPGPTAMPAA